jgi:hypothetical protein
MIVVLHAPAACVELWLSAQWAEAGVVRQKFLLLVRLPEIAVVVLACCVAATFMCRW